MTLTENITYDKNGYPEENSLFQYKIPARTDVGKIKVEFESSYEPTDPLAQSPSARWSSIHRCLPFPMRSTMPLVPGSMSCPSHRKKSPWQLQKSRNDRRKNFSVSCGEGTCYFSGGRRRKDHTDVQSGCALRPQGWRVLAATTTHIMQPPGGVWAQTDAELFRLWKCGSYAVAGTAAHGGKLTAPPQAQLERWMTLADIVLIEADGAKRMPCKHPLRTSRCFYRSAIRFWP